MIEYYYWQRLNVFSMRIGGPEKGRFVEASTDESLTAKTVQGAALAF